MTHRFAFLVFGHHSFPHSKEGFGKTIEIAQLTILNVMYVYTVYTQYILSLNFCQDKAPGYDNK